MLEVVSQIIIYLILATIVGIVIGYFLGKNNCARGKPKIIKKDKVNQIVKKEEIDIGKKPTLLKEARGGVKDNLQLIKGVGPVLEKVLNDIGIYHFDQITNLTQEEVTWLDRSIAFPGRIGRESWINQSKSLQEGIATEYSTRVKNGEITVKTS